jgi:hypothetical protein
LWEQEDQHIIAFHELTAHKTKEFTSDECALIAYAYSKHDQHFNITWQERMKAFEVSDTKKRDYYIKAISEHVQRRLSYPQVIEHIMSNPQDLSRCLEDYSPEVPYWTTTEKIYVGLQGHVASGYIHNLESYYAYMTTYYMNEVLGNGW